MPRLYVGWGLRGIILVHFNTIFHDVIISAPIFYKNHKNHRDMFFLLLFPPEGDFDRRQGGEWGEHFLEKEQVRKRYFKKYILYYISSSVYLYNL